MKKRDIDLKTSSEASREARFLFSIVAFFLLFRSVRAGKPGFRPGKSGLSGLRNGVSGRFPDSESPLAIPETALPTAKTGLSPSQKATPKTRCCWVVERHLWELPCLNPTMSDVCSVAALCAAEQAFHQPPGTEVSSS